MPLLPATLTVDSLFRIATLDDSDRLLTGHCHFRVAANARSYAKSEALIPILVHHELSVIFY